MSSSPRPKRSTYERALDMLEARARGADELRRLLVRKGEPAADVDETIERLTRAGLLDDAAYARQLARSKALGAGMSRRRIQQELARRGVARDITAEAIADVFEDESVDEGKLIERAAAKKLRTLGRLDEPTRRRRLYAFLARRGFDADDIQRVMRTVLDGAEDENPRPEQVEDRGGFG
ncbi:MAG TPA: regulatory protein RecX [Gemmatimonadaceae bacterium]|nr:regulatory protein RecX [Gemmatimonadaceae bacterium]